MSNPPQSVPFGLWPSPISAGLLSRRTRLDEVLFDAGGRTLLWLEGRSDGSCLVARQPDDSPRALTDEHNPRGGVGYAGGEFTAANGVVIFADRGGRLFRRTLGYGRPQPITPPFGSVASPALSPDGEWVLYVFSDGKDDCLALVDSQGGDWPVKLARGADFYMQPAWHPAGKQIAWVEWKHPNMPWDGTRICLGTLAGTPPRLTETRVIAGDEHTPAAQPLFSPDGRWLSYILADGDWERLELYNLETGAKHTLLQGEGLLLSQPAWVQGMRSMAWSHDGSRLFSIHNYAGQASLWQIEFPSGVCTQIPTAPYTWLTQLSVSAADELAFLASAPGIPDRVVRWDGHALHVEARSETESTDPAYLPELRDITWKAADGTLVHALYAAPRNPRCIGEGLPPAIFSIHGGPTAQSRVRYSGETAYFTSRGYAWIEVNYRGSSGYGRSYQDALRLRWGELDVEDAVGAAQACVEQGLADPQRLVILGGSAGGYTVLNALIRHPGRFKAGVSLYGVSNLFAIAMDTHKFELHYNDSLLGALPEAAARYHAWSPVFHASAIRDPLAVFQGSADKAVPPQQSEEIVTALRRSGTPHIYRLYEGEGHGFRKTETLLDYYQQVERFLQTQVLFTA